MGSYFSAAAAAACGSFTLKDYCSFSFCSNINYNNVYVPFYLYNTSATPRNQFKHIFICVCFTFPSITLLILEHRASFQELKLWLVSLAAAVVVVYAYFYCSFHHPNPESGCLF
jgi:hypothetical protein